MFIGKSKFIFAFSIHDDDDATHVDRFVNLFLRPWRQRVAMRAKPMGGATLTVHLPNVSVWFISTTIAIADHGVTTTMIDKPNFRRPPPPDVRDIQS